MCGIVGFVGAGDEHALRAMAAAVAHRGPDGESFHIERAERVFLGHRRLAVLDIAGGAQPMWNEDGTVAVLFNGEIYNHADLRVELQARGHRFRSNHSDTEVLVHGYEEWGHGLPGRLNGMFAFAVYDGPRRRFFLARDRFGEKPLYYATGPDLFAFGSELGALAAHPMVDRSIDQASLQKYFAYGFLPAPLALYRRSRKLPGGCHLTLDFATRTPTVARYWQFLVEPDERLTARGEADLADELAEHLVRATGRRLEADVPLGLFLSGGVDSSSVLAAATRQRAPAEIDTFTIGFNEPSYDESAQAESVARFFGTRHHQQTLDLRTCEALIDSVLGRLDEPLGDASILPTHLLCAFARRRVTVALSGDGGDEMFAGYDPFRALGPARLYNALVPTGLHRLFLRMANLLPVSHANMSFDFKLRRALTGLSYGTAMWNPVWLSPLEPARIAELFDQPLAPEELYSEALAVWHANRTGNLVDRTLEFYTNLYLQDDILTKTDRAAMMVSLEARAVFLDNDLVDFCRRLPHRMKYRRGERKYLLRKAMARLLPRAVLERPKKGFGIPIVDWLRRLPQFTAEPLPGASSEWVAARWQAHRAGVADERLFLWSWLSASKMLGRDACPPPLEGTARAALAPHVDAAARRWWGR